MCNPRRVNVTATQELTEAWQREICRTVSVQGKVAGEARVRRPLDTSMAEPMLRALESELAGGADGWHETDDGFQVDLPGGFLIYHRDRSLEIVARLEQDISVEGTATETVTGQLDGTVSAEGVGTYFDDGWGGRNEDTARKAAEEEAQRRLQEQIRSRLDDARRAGENAADAAVRARAEAAAREELLRESQRQQAALNRRAEERLTSFQVAAMQLFYRRAGAAYRNVLLAHARQQGASDIVQHEDGDTVEISFRLPA